MYELLNITADAGQNKSYRIRVTNNCPEPLIYTAIQIPDGVTAMSPADNSLYEGPVSGQDYLVRNPNYSPFYSIRFKSTTDSIAFGESEIFRYKLPAQSNPTYINITAKLLYQKFYEAHLNTFNCPIGVTPPGERPVILRDFAPEAVAEIRLFPNPTSGVLFADLSDWKEQAVQIRVIDSRGQMVLQRSLSATDGAQMFELPSAMASGLYFFDMITENGEKVSTRFNLIR